jgi:hypothetical protein
MWAHKPNYALPQLPELLLGFTESFHVAPPSMLLSEPISLDLQLIFSWLSAVPKIVGLC